MSGSIPTSPVTTPVTTEQPPPAPTKDASAKRKVDDVAQPIFKKPRPLFPPNPLTPERTRFIQERGAIDPFLARAIANRGASVLASDPEIKKEHLATKYNIKPGKPTDQASSGRCWIFSSLNLMRLYRLKDYGKDFEYSQNFVAFYDKLERANHFLETITSFHDRPASSHEMQFVLEHMFSDGGEWELFANVVKKYGVVPKSAMPETTYSGHSSGYMSMIKKRLRTAAGVIHQQAQKIAALAEGAEREAAITELKDKKDQVLSTVYRMLCSYLGKPPENFLWKDPQTETYSRVTPLEFYEQSQCELDTKVHLTHLPYHPANTKLVAPDIGNVEEGDRLQAFNTSMDAIKAAIRASIKAGEAVEIACEMDHLDSEKNLLSTQNNQMSTLFGMDPSIRLDKGKELQYQATCIAHGMILVGCDDPDTNRAPTVEGAPPSLGPLWKVENSWKNRSTLYMTDQWFDQYCYGIVVDKKFLPDALVEEIENPQKVVALAPFDPFCRI